MVIHGLPKGSKLSWSASETGMGTHSSRTVSRLFPGKQTREVSVNRHTHMSQSRSLQASKTPRRSARSKMMPISRLSQNAEPVLPFFRFYKTKSNLFFPRQGLGFSSPRPIGSPIRSDRSGPAARGPAKGPSRMPGLAGPVTPASKKTRFRWRHTRQLKSNGPHQASNTYRCLYIYIYGLYIYIYVQHESFQVSRP